MNKELRPLSARALKSCIDTLRPYLPESKVLDLYAGQGRFGIEALKEGALHVTFVESHSKTSQELKKALTHPSIPQGLATVVASEVFSYLEKQTDTFDIIFADPPFSLWDKAFELKLLTHITNISRANSILILKHPKKLRLSALDDALKHWKTSVFGESALTYFRASQI